MTEKLELIDTFNVPSPDDELAGSYLKFLSAGFLFGIAYKKACIKTRDQPTLFVLLGLLEEKTNLALPGFPDGMTKEQMEALAFFIDSRMKIFFNVI